VIGLIILLLWLQSVVWWLSMWRLYPSGFVLAALAGTGIHLFSFDLLAETAIAVSVITFAMLVMPNKPNWLVLTVWARSRVCFTATPTVSQLLAQE